MTIDVLEADPEPAVWQQICVLAEGASPQMLAQLAMRLREWPARLRPMPDRWWQQRQSGQAQPWHALATHRRLCDLGDYFYPSTVACPSDLSLLLVGTGATGNNDLGEVTLMLPLRDAEIERGDDYDDEAELEELTVATLAEDSEAVDACFSPDGSRAAVGFSSSGDPTVYSIDGRELFNYTAAAAGDDVGFVRVDHCTDTRLLAAGWTGGTVIVAEPSSGTLLLEAEGTTGPVALDHGGNRLAYACAGGRIALLDVPSGELMSTFDTGLEAVNALAFSPHADTLLAAGGDRPTACLLDLHTGAASNASADATMDAASPFAGFATRACWTPHGPLVFASDDYLAVLFNGRDGGTLWTSAEGQLVGSFTPDGRVLVASGPHGTVDAWFLETLGPAPC